MKQSIRTSSVCFGLLLVASWAGARDFGALVPPLHKGKWTSSLLYESLKVADDFDSRGRSDFKCQVVGSQFTYGITETIAAGIKGGALVDPQQEAQGSRWEGQSGYLYGFDLYNEIFPATGYWPGVMLSAGVSQFRAPLGQVIDPAGAATLVDQRISGLDYHAALLLGMKWGQVSPYLGMRLFGRDVNWHDNQSAISGGPASINGDSHGNASIVVGLPVRLTQELHFHVEGIFVNQTSVTAGFTLAAF